MKRQIIAMGGGGFSMEPDNLLLDVNGRVKTRHCGRVQNQPVMFPFI